MANVESGSEPPETSKSLWRTIWKDVVLIGTGNIGYAIGQFCFRSILVVALVPAAYGRLTLVLSIYNTVWLIASGGLPGAVARHLALVGSAGDEATTKMVFISAVWPTVAGALAMGAMSGLILHSVPAAAAGAIGLGSLVYASICIGVLRGRHRISPAASIMPVTALGELAPLILLAVSGIGVTILSAFCSFCAGNVVGLLMGFWLVKRTRPARTHEKTLAAPTTSKELLSFSMWLAIAATGLALLPLVVRFAASIESFSDVAVADIALVLFAIPQRLGALMAVAMTPHASRAIHVERARVEIPRREQFLTIVPFVVAAAVVGFSPLAGDVARAINRPEYAKSGTYLALVLLAGPARVLYGVVSGVLIGHGDARFLAITVMSIAAVASGGIFAAAALGYLTLSFALLVPAFWLIYLSALWRLERLESRSDAIRTA